MRLWKKWNTLARRYVLLCCDPWRKLPAIQQDAGRFFLFDCDDQSNSFDTSFPLQNVEVVDTTCPWVSKVWNVIDKHQKKGLTSIIHGKYAHEETVATVSFCDDYICVKNMEEAEMVANYIVNGGDKEAFMKYFEAAVSKGFDPDTMLEKIGLANQTTMYKKETRAIGQLFQKTMMQKFGPVDVATHYMEFDTICDATQVRDVHAILRSVATMR